MSKVGLSEGFVYTTKTPAAAAANIRVSVPPHNKDQFVRGNDTMMFNIPCGKRGQYLNTRMSYLKFDIEVKVDLSKNVSGYTPVLCLDGGASSLIQHLELYHGTNLLEQIREYNAMYQLVADMTNSAESCSRHLSVSDGGSGADVISGERYGAIITPISHTNIAPISARRTEYYLKPTGQGENTKWDANITSGGSVYSKYETKVVPFSSSYEVEMFGRHAYKSSDDEDPKTETGIATDTVTHTFCIPIMSGIIGPQQGKYIPVGALAADLRLELGLAPFKQAFRAFGAIKTEGSGANMTHTFTNNIDDINALSSMDSSPTHEIAIRNAELMLEYIEVASDVQSSIESAVGGQYIMSFESFHNFQNAVPADTVTFTQLIGAKFSSVKTAISMFRSAEHINNISRGGVTSRLNPFSTLPNRPEAHGHDFGKSSFPDTKYLGGSGWYYSVGSTHYPPKPVQSDQESYYEALKSQHLVGSSPDSLVTKYNWNVSARADTASNSQSTPTYFSHARDDGTFFVAQNFESQSHKSQFAETGINTLAQNVYIHARFPPSSSVFGPNPAIQIGKFPVTQQARFRSDSENVYTYGDLEYTQETLDNFTSTEGRDFPTINDIADLRVLIQFGSPDDKILFEALYDKNKAIVTDITDANYNYYYLPKMYTVNDEGGEEELPVNESTEILTALKTGTPLQEPLKSTYVYIKPDFPAVFAGASTVSHTYAPVVTGYAYKEDSNTLSKISKWEQYNTQMTVDHFIHYDGILLITNGICNSRF